MSCWQRNLIDITHATHIAAAVNVSRGKIDPGGRLGKKDGNDVDSCRSCSRGGCQSDTPETFTCPPVENKVRVRMIGCGPRRP